MNMGKTTGRSQESCEKTCIKETSLELRIPIQSHEDRLEGK